MRVSRTGPSQETCNFDVLYSYLTTSNYDFAYDMTRKARPAKSVKTALNHEIMMYAVCQKEPLGLDKAVEEIRFRMSRYNVRPNMMVIPPQLALYMALAPEPKTLYTEGGPKADAQFEAGYEGFESRSFRGLTVVTSEPFEVAEDQESVQMLTRNTQVGEHYIMKPPEPGQKIDPEQRGFCDIVIYDEEGDQHVRMSWSDAVKATCASELIGNVVGATGPTVSDGTNAAPNLKEWLEHAVAWAWLNENGYENKEAPPVDWAKKFGDNFGLDAAKIKAKADEVKKNGRKRVQIVLARPFIEHEMHSAVVAVAGKDTGCTLFGPSDMQIAANIQVKTIEGHYTCHVKSVVSKPQNVFVARDVCCAGYVAGGNVGYFTKGRNGQCSMIEGQKNLTERLGVNSGMTDYHPSLFAFPSMEEHTIAHTQMDTVMSLTGRMLPWNTSNPQDDAKDKFPGGKEMFDSYKKGINFGSIHYGEDGQASRAHAFVSAGSVNNSLCFRGPHRVFNPYSTKIMNLVPGLGHFGPDAIPGVSPAPTSNKILCTAARPPFPFPEKLRTSPTRTATVPVAGCTLAARRVDVFEGGSRGDGAGASRASYVVSTPCCVSTHLCVCLCVFVCVLRPSRTRRVVARVAVSSPRWVSRRFRVQVLCTSERFTQGRHLTCHDDWSEYP